MSGLNPICLSAGGVAEDHSWLVPGCFHPADRSNRMRLAGRPTVQTLAIVFLAFVGQQLAGLVGLEYWLFVLDPSVTVRPWTLVTSVYAHLHVGHLLSNVVGIAILGPLVSWRTTTGRFHAFFLTVGAISGLGQVFIGGLVGPATAVLGASGAVFGLLGYVLAGNPLTRGLLGWANLSRRSGVILLVGVAVLLTVATGSPGSALIGHAVGLVAGLVAGRVALLEASPQ